MAMICRNRLLIAAACVLGLLMNTSPARATNVAPTISGTPARSVYEGFAYRFAPMAAAGSHRWQRIATAMR